MRIVRFIVAVGASLPLATACVHVIRAPGADHVRTTKVPADVASCTAVGNIKVQRNPDGSVPVQNPDMELRNLTVGLGGNTPLVTVTAMGVPRGNRVSLPVMDRPAVVCGSGSER